MAQVVESRRILELDLRKALANEEFELFFQPLVNLKSGRISTCRSAVALESSGPRHGLADRHHSGRRGHGPDRRSRPLDFAQGLHGMRMKWPEGVSVAVNFSPQQFHQRDVLSEVRYALEVSGLQANRLEIEITESSLLREHATDARCAVAIAFARRADIARRFRHRLFQPRAYLHNFPLQKVKIDRSFLEGIDSDRPLTLLRGVARLSADSGLDIIRSSPRPHASHIVPDMSPGSLILRRRTVGYHSPPSSRLRLLTLCPKSKMWRCRPPLEKRTNIL